MMSKPVWWVPGHAGFMAGLRGFASCPKWRPMNNPSTKSPLHNRDRWLTWMLETMRYKASCQTWPMGWSVTVMSYLLFWLMVFQNKLKQDLQEPKIQVFTIWDLEIVATSNKPRFWDSSFKRRDLQLKLCQDTSCVTYQHATPIAVEMLSGYQLFETDIHWLNWSTPHLCQTTWLQQVLTLFL